MGKMGNEVRRLPRPPVWQAVFLLGILLWMATGSPALYVVFLGSAIAIWSKK